ncbi:23943_t:CDS:10 [Dentiscutata erythropus]|uniref:23943_t:CDS:1 n=1 Tax=Dentiscutata erythropus TaxID=1348616 RepID=A0A9N9AS18_9GLOM|nr:23943_t:CDS:10 [Dentiscutata erythropus]
MLKLLEVLFLNSEKIPFLYFILSLFVISIACVAQNNTFYDPLPDNDRTFTNRAGIGRLVASSIILIIWSLLLITCQDSIELQRNILWLVAWIYATALALALILIPQQCPIFIQYCLRFSTNINAKYFMVFLVVGLLHFLILILEPIYSEDRNSIPEVNIYPSNWIFSWVIPFIITGYKRTLTPKDVPELPNSHRAENVMNAYNKNRNTSLLISFFFSFRKHLFIQFLCALAWIICDFSIIPSLFKELLSFIEDYSNDNESQLFACLYIYALLLIKVLSKLLLQRAQYIGRQTANRCQTIITIEVYGKMMDLTDGEEKGKITDLMSIDAQKVSSMIVNFLYLYSSPIQICVSIYSLYSLLDVSSIFVIIIMSLLAFLLIIWITQRYKTAHEHLMKATDKRIELLQSILNVKLLVRDRYFRKSIREARESELNKLEDRFKKSLYMELLLFILPFLVILPALCWFPSKNKLSASIAFTAFVICYNLHKAFKNLPYQIICFTQAHVSISRVEKFLNESEIVQIYSSRSDGSIGFKKATLQWPNNSNNFILKGLDVIFPPGKLSLIHGPTGCGKSALLRALLGEMKCLKGSVHFPNEIDIAYVSQTVWLQNGTIKDNILFGSDFIAKKYFEVKRICDLTFDDETEIGERGNTLSVGQKQRIALARTIYSDHNIIILDNCLSAVDSRTEKHIYEQCLMSDLMKNKTRILVTHHKKFYGVALKIFMKDGMIIKKKYLYLNSEELQHDFKEFEHEELPVIKNSDKLIKEEAKANGWVKLNVYMTYLNASSEFFWILIAILFMYTRSIQTYQVLLISEWTKVHDNDNRIFDHLMDYASLGVLEIISIIIRSFLVMCCTLSISRKLHNDLLIRILYTTIGFFDTTPIGRIMNRFSKDMELIDQILPLNIESLINSCISVILAFIVISIQGLMYLAICIIITATYMIIGIRYISISRELRRLESVNRSPMYAAFDNVIIYFNLYNECKYLDPFTDTYSFEKTIEGRSIIRAFDAKERFNKSLWDFMDCYNRSILMNWACNQWMHVYSNFIGGLFMLIIGALTIDDLSKGMDPAFAGFIFINFIKFINHINHIINAFTAVEMNMNSGKINEYLTLEEEDSNINESPAEWPAKGEIEVKNLKMQYFNDGPSVLSSISFCVSAGEKIGIVGKTGSGKSTLVKSLFRIVNPTDGQIIIDGVDISTINLYYLRKKIAIIPQNPALFNGTLKSNIDFSGLRSDDELWDVLRKAHLIEECTFNNQENDMKIEQLSLDTIIKDRGNSGCVVNFDHPYKLLQNQKPLLRKMFQNEEFEDLFAVAKLNYEERLLNIV